MTFTLTKTHAPDVEPVTSAQDHHLKAAEHTVYAAHQVAQAAKKTPGPSLKSK